MRNTRLVACVLGLAASAGCAVGFGAGQHVGYAHGQIENQGYRIEYVDASPKPGAFLVEGTVVPIQITVRYTLLIADTGHLLLQVHKGNSEEQYGEQAVRSISRCTACTATIPFELVVPSGMLAVSVNIDVIPEGARTRSGALIVAYRVGKGPGDRD